MSAGPNRANRDGCAGHFGSSASTW